MSKMIKVVYSKKMIPEIEIYDSHVGVPTGVVMCSDEGLVSVCSEAIRDELSKLTSKDIMIKNVENVDE